MDRHPSRPAARRVSLLLGIVGLLVLWLGPSGSLSGAGRTGVYLSPSGYRAPIYGMSAIRDAQGNLGSECVRLTATQVEGARFSRSVSRAMLAQAPRSTVQAVSGLTFQIVYSDASGTGFLDPQHGERKKALEASLAAWSKVLQGTVPVVVQAHMESPQTEKDKNMLARAGPIDFFLVDGIGVPSALADQLKGKSLNGDDPDIDATFNLDADWDYAPNGAAARNKPSFVYTAMHEIAHGLGFLDSFDIETGELMNSVPFPYDGFLNRGSGAILRIMDRSSSQVMNDLVSGDVFFSGPKAVAASKRSIRPLPMVKLYAPNPYEPGSSIAHVDQDTYADFKTGLMAPQDFGSGTDKVDILTLGIMEDMGYGLVPGAVTARKP